MASEKNSAGAGEVQVAVVASSRERMSGKDLVLLHRKNSDSLVWWIEKYLSVWVTTVENSGREQRRDIQAFLWFMMREVKHDHPDAWTPRLTHAFKAALQNFVDADGTRHWSDRSINRMLAHLKTFAKWVHGHRPFMLGNPTEKVKQIPTGSLLLVECAITDTERRRILDAADMLPKVGGLSRDRYRHKSPNSRPVRKGYRPWRNRAIVYTLIETGMRRAGVCRINLADVDFDGRQIEVEEKGGATHSYKISREGLAAISDYLAHKRKQDKKHFADAPALFLPAATVPNSDGQLTPLVINDVWSEVCKAADVHGKTPHLARHARGRYIIEKTGNVAAVQRQLGHKNAAYSLQYTRITREELGEVLDTRE